jgi:hypothetical protein
MSNDRKGDQTWAANLQRSDQTAAQEKDTGPTLWERMAPGLAGVGEFIKEQTHAAGQDLVSRVLLGESYSPPQVGEKEPEPQHDKDHDIDR